MKNKILVIGLILCQVAQISAMDKPSVYDPLGALSAEERSRIDAEGRTIIANRKVNGQDLLIQIDFLSKDEFDEGGVTGRDNSGRTLFSLGTYTNWSVRYFSQPAVLMLFLDQGNGNYALDALNFSDMLMDEGIPDLVRRYIRDEIMKKEISYVETISSGLYAIGEALNKTYINKLISEHRLLFSGNQYQRRHAWPGAIPMNYYSFEPYHVEYQEIIPKTIKFVENSEYLDWSEVSYNNTEILDITIDYSQTSEPWYNQYLIKKIKIPVLREIIDNPITHEDNEKLITNLFKKDLVVLLNDPVHYNNQNFYPHNESILPLAFHGKHPKEVFVEHRLDRFGCRIKILKHVMDKPWQYIPDVINRAIYPGWREKGPTWCNQYCRDLSKQIFGNYIFESLSANDLNDYLHNSDNYIKINANDPWEFIKKGYLVLFSYKSASGSGHVEVGLPYNTPTLTSDYSNINTNQEKFTVGAGAIMGAKKYNVSPIIFDKFLYLGYLKRNI